MAVHWAAHKRFIAVIELSSEDIVPDICGTKSNSLFDNDRAAALKSTDPSKQYTGQLTRIP